MPRPPRSGPLRTLALGLLAACCPSAGFGDDPPASHPALDTRASTDAMKAIKPLPVVAIPDDPPPHEGAMIDIPLIIEPPDIIVIEVLEALPGRPISGERLVRPDGTIMHAEVRVDDSVIMIGDAGGAWQPVPSHVHLYVRDVDEAFRRALAAGGVPVQEPQRRPGDPDKRGGVRDPAGNTWWIGTQQAS